MVNTEMLKVQHKTEQITGVYNKMPNLVKYLKL